MSCRDQSIDLQNQLTMIQVLIEKCFLTDYKHQKQNHTKQLLLCFFTVNATYKYIYVVSINTRVGHRNNWERKKCFDFISEVPKH